MKNKLKKTMTALCAALILMGGFSVPAYAQGAATEPNAGDVTNDSNVVVEEKEETPPLTPKGNATLVDDYGGNKQLITVTTKSGNYRGRTDRTFPKSSGRSRPYGTDRKRRSCQKAGNL